MADDQENGSSEDVADKDDLYMEPKPKPKVIRVMTVLAYILSVSMAAILLSIYYVFMWDGQPTLARRTDPRMQHRIGLQDYDYPDFRHNNIQNITTDTSEEKVFLNTSIPDAASLDVDNFINDEYSNATTDSTTETNTRSSNDLVSDKGLDPLTELYDIYTSSAITSTEESLMDGVNEEEDSANIDSMDIRNNLFYKKYFHKKLILP